MPAAGRRIPPAVVIPATLVIAMILTISPLPEWASIWRPAWLLMCVIYWCLAMPNVFGVATAWFAGLMLDVFQATLLGQHALGFAIVAYAAARYHLVIRNLALVQQALLVGAMVTSYNLLQVAVDRIAGYGTLSVEVGASALSSVLLWPWVFLVLRAVRRRWLRARYG